MSKGPKFDALLFAVNGSLNATSKAALISAAVNGSGYGVYGNPTGYLDGLSHDNPAAWFNLSTNFARIQPPGKIKHLFCQAFTQWLHKVADSACAQSQRVNKRHAGKHNYNLPLTSCYLEQIGMQSGEIDKMCKQKICWDFICRAFLGTTSCLSFGTLCLQHEDWQVWPLQSQFVKAFLLCSQLLWHWGQPKWELALEYLCSEPHNFFPSQFTERVPDCCCNRSSVCGQYKCWPCNQHWVDVSSHSWLLHYPNWHKISVESPWVPFILSISPLGHCRYRPGPGSPF